MHYYSVSPEGMLMFREETAKIEELSERISKLRGSL
jgi:hypothetical protein